jgi:ubiquinone/menaquinone biosynthesis C-methylase UbiE
MTSAHEPFTRVITNAENEAFREAYIKNWVRSQAPGLSVLDVGAGAMPYKSDFLENGLVYKSHDFELYDGSSNSAGLQNPNWPVSGHDLVCDIENLPIGDFDLVLCTEVLEHVPNPVEALRAISRSLKLGGVAMVTVPFSSRMHQAPYWYSAGLSPFWFQKHGHSLGLNCEVVLIAGDYVDQMQSELPQFLSAYTFFGVNIGYRVSRFIRLHGNWIRNKLPRDLLDSGGLGVYVQFKKFEN